MPDRTQDLTNHRKVATACKNYTDEQIAESEERIKWYIGEYQTTTQDDNTTAYQKTVPSGATRVKIKRIYGNTLKYNPSVASDSTVAFMKTLPDTVYTLDVSYVYGASEVSENLILSYEQGTYASQEYNNRISFCFGSLSQTITVKAFDSSFKFIIQKFTKGTRNYIENVSSWVSTSYTFTTNGTDDYVIVVGRTDDSSLTPNNTTYIMAVVGSTAPTEFKVGYEGIHNFAWNGLKVEGFNKAKLQDIPQTTINGITYKVSNNAVSLGGTATAATSLYLPFVEDIEIGTYSYNQFYKNTGHNVYLAPQQSSSDTTLLITQNSTSSISTNFTTQSVMKYLFIYIGNGNTIANYTFTPMVVRGEIAPTEYQPYVTPTTKTIDLSTILYNGNPLFEGNNLKAVGTAKDYITPYLAHKEIGTRAYQSGDEEDSDVITDGTNTLYVLATPIEVSIDWSSTLRGIQGYSNGTITLQNTYNMNTANTITYNSMIKENCCSKIVQTRGGDVVKTINLPTQASDGYSAGSVSNVRDFTTNKRYTNVNKNNNLGDLTWQYNIANNVFYASISDKVIRYQVTTYNIICSKYETGEGTGLSDMVDKTIIETYLGSRTDVAIKDTLYNGDSATFKTAMTNESLYYELADASKTETDITTIENIIEVEPNDVLSFYNSDDELVTIPSDLTYRIEVARV